MKYLFFIPLLLLCLLNCTQTKRAGSLYSPDMYTKIRTQPTDKPIDKTGTQGDSYHSALGNLCTHYTQHNQQSLVCSNGNNEQQVRILQ